MPSRSEPHMEKCRLSEGNTPGVLECRPGPKRIPAVYSVVQQKSFQESHVIGSQFLASTQRPTRPMVPILSESAGPVETIVVQSGRGGRRQAAAPAAQAGLMSSPAILSRPAELCGCCGVRTTLRRLRDENPEGRPESRPRKTSRRAVFLRDDADATISHSRPGADAGLRRNRWARAGPGPSVRSLAQSFLGIRRSRSWRSPRAGSAHV
jgi:hypothetical protein